MTPGANKLYRRRSHSGKTCSSFERLFLRFGAANEATVSDADVADETPRAEKGDLTVLIDNRAVACLGPRHPLAPICGSGKGTKHQKPKVAYEVRSVRRRRSRRSVVHVVDCPIKAQAGQGLFRPHRRGLRSDRDDAGSPVFGLLGEAWRTFTGIGAQ